MATRAVQRRAAGRLPCDDRPFAFRSPSIRSILSRSPDWFVRGNMRPPRRTVIWLVYLT